MGLAAACSLHCSASAELEAAVQLPTQPLPFPEAGEAAAARDPSCLPEAQPGAAEAGVPRALPLLELPVAPVLSVLLVLPEAVQPPPQAVQAVIRWQPEAGAAVAPGYRPTVLRAEAEAAVPGAVVLPILPVPAEVTERQLPVEPLAAVPQLHHHHHCRSIPLGEAAVAVSVLPEALPAAPAEAAVEAEASLSFEEHNGRRPTKYKCRPSDLSDVRQKQDYVLVSADGA